MWDIQHFLFFLTFIYHWEILYKPHCKWCWVMLTHAGHVIPQLILYKLCSKTSLQALQPYKLPIQTSQLHPAEQIPPNLVPHPYLIFRNRWDIQHIVFLLTSSYHWEILYKPHSQQCWVKAYTCWSCHFVANTLQVIQKNVTTSFLTLYISNSNFTVVSGLRATPKFYVTPLPNL